VSDSDVIGLPPTPEEVDRFVALPSSYEALVDTLLTSPRFGESGRGTGWMSSASLSPMALRQTVLVTTHGRIAITSLSRSTTTNPTTSSSASSWLAMH